MTLYIGDVRDGLRQFAAQNMRAQTCVTSPPYWGLRDYGTAQWDGGDLDCEHTATRRGHGGDEKQATSAGTSRDPIRGGDCRLCGARRVDHQLGLEPTIAEYVANMVDVFRLVRDVLADDGTLWLNLGDSYATGAGKVGVCPGGGAQGDAWNGPMTQPNRLPQAGLKPKDLCGIPWRVAFALQADGWYLRSDIIWHKPNPMPESITDRPTKSHEYLFLLSKRERYYYDAEAIKEASITGDARVPYGSQGAWDMDGRVPEKRNGGKVRSPAGWKTGPGAHGTIHADGREQSVSYAEIDATVRNRRSVWTIATSPYADAHFAVFPEALVEPCIAAGSRVGDVILDPFMGSGTVARVAQRLGRKWAGCELNSAYAAMVETRTKQSAMALAAAD